MSPEVLGQATALLSQEQDPRLLVGFDLADDAGVVRLDADRALVQTVDFFTPIVDDPFLFGRIAATNALSDVYAMGGTPLTAMNIVCWNDKDFPVSVLAKILAGGQAAVKEAGALLVGGHSVTDDEVKYGLAVTGMVHPDRVWANQGARGGDLLVLTKPVGTGILCTAAKRDACPSDALDAAIAAMTLLNRAARDVGAQGQVHAATDITGNGLVGHAWEIAAASGVRLVLRGDAVPLLPEVLALADAGHLTRGETTNRLLVGESLDFGQTSSALQSVLLDPQTSGGLLLAVPDASRFDGVGVVVGVVEEGPPAVVIR